MPRKGAHWEVLQKLTLTHGFKLADQLLFRPLRPFLLVGVDGAQYRTTRLATVFDGWYIQVMDQYNVRVLRETKKNKHNFRHCDQTSNRRR